MKNVEKLKTLEGTKDFLNGLPEECRKNIAQVFSNKNQQSSINKSTKRIIQHFLRENWTQIFGTSVKKRTKNLTTADYVLCLESISEAESIPHNFKSLLFSIFYDSDKQGFKHMWDPIFRKRTALSIKKIVCKAVNQLRVGNEKSRIATQENLVALRKEKVDYANYEAVKMYYEKIANYVRELDEQAMARFRSEN